MNENSFKVMLGIGVVALVLMVGVGFASLSTNLTINGEGTVKASTWEIKFENLQPVGKTGSAAEVTAPTIDSNSTHIGDYEVTFTKPGDSISYTFDVVNNGTLDAKISSITVPTPTCTGSGADTTAAAADAANVCAHLSYTLTYANGTAVAQNDTLAPGASNKKTMKLTLTYKDTITADKLPKNDVAIDNLEVAVTYAQN